MKLKIFKGETLIGDAEVFEPSFGELFANHPSFKTFWGIE